MQILATCVAFIWRLFGLFTAVSDEEEVLNDENVDSWEDIDGNIFQSFVFPLVKKGSYLYCNEISILTSSYTHVIICQTM